MNTSPLPATASPDDTHGSSPRDTSAAGSVTGRVEVLGLDWPTDIALIRVDGVPYTLSVDLDQYAPTGHGGSSRPAWSVNWSRVDEAVDEAIGEHDGAICDAINHFWMEAL